MPVLILAVAEYLDELLQDRRVATVAPLCKLCRVVEMAIYLAFMFVVGVLGSEHRWTY